MKRRWRWIGVLGVAVVAGSVCWKVFAPGLPGEIKTSLEQGDACELLTLDPMSQYDRDTPDSDKWHGYKILGSSTLSPEMRKQLIGSLDQAVHEGAGY